MNMDHGGVFITASELFLLAGNPEWALMISRSASLCEIPGARTGVTRAISAALRVHLPSTTGTRLLGHQLGRRYQGG